MLASLAELDVRIAEAVPQRHPGNNRQFSPIWFAAPVSAAAAGRVAYISLRMLWSQTRHGIWSEGIGGLPHSL